MGLAPLISIPSLNSLAAKEGLTLPLPWLPLLQLNPVPFSDSRQQQMLLLLLPQPLPPRPSLLQPPSPRLPLHRMILIHVRVVSKDSHVRSTECLWHKHKQTLLRKRLLLKQHSWLTLKSRVLARMPAVVCSKSLAIRFTYMIASYWHNLFLWQLMETSNL